MVVFSTKPSGYKLGVILLFLAVVVLLTGVIAPYWVSKYYSSVVDDSGTLDLTLNEGPWMLCVAGRRSSGSSSSSSTVCQGFGFDLGGWFHAVRALLIVGVVLLLVACVLSLVINCVLKRPLPERLHRILEPFGLLAGLSSMAAVVVYDALRNERLPVILSQNQTLQMDALNSLNSTVLQGPGWSYNWAIYLAGSGAILAVLAAMVIWIFNKKSFSADSFGDDDWGRDERRGKSKSAQNGQSALKSKAGKKGKSAEKGRNSKARDSRSDRKDKHDKRGRKSTRDGKSAKDGKGGQRGQSPKGRDKSRSKSKDDNGNSPTRGPGQGESRGSNGGAGYSVFPNKWSDPRLELWDYPAYSGRGNAAYEPDYPPYDGP